MCTGGDGLLLIYSGDGFLVARLETLLRELREVAEYVVVAVYAQSHVVPPFS